MTAVASGDQFYIEGVNSMSILTVSCDNNEFMKHRYGSNDIPTFVANGDATCQYELRTLTNVGGKSQTISGIFKVQNGLVYLQEPKLAF
jgi:hypothetical protein